MNIIPFLLLTIIALILYIAIVEAKLKLNLKVISAFFVLFVALFIIFCSNSLKEVSAKPVVQIIKHK